ncbi:MAG: helix-turn-helix domain-containing protein [Verrucomicrobiales bacterium]
MKSTGIRREFFRRLGSGDELLRIFDLLPDVSFFVKDRQCRFVALNQRGTEYCGATREDEVVGKTDHDFFPPQRADAYQADDLAVMDSGEPIVNRIESAPEQSGSPRLVMTSKLPLHDAGGRVIGVVGFSRQVDRRRASSSVEAASFTKVVEYLHQNFDKPITTAEMANIAGVSVSHFDRTFRAAFGDSPIQYLLRIRIETACRLLKETDQTIVDIALACGFHDHAHFSRCFKKHMGKPPSEYRKE